MDKQKLITRTLIGAGIVVIAYQLYKWGTRPKDPSPKPQDDKKSSAEGKITTEGGVKVTVPKIKTSEEINTKEKRDAYIKARGYSTGEKRYDDSYGKVFQFRNDDKGARWILLADQSQPKPMEWLLVNNKWYWSNWRNKLVNYDGKKVDYWRDKFRLTLPEDNKKVGQEKLTTKPSF